MPSSFGRYRVRVVEVEPGRVPPFEEVEHQIFGAFQRRETYATSGPRITAGRDVLDPVEAWIDPTSGAVQERVVRRTAPPAGVTTSCQTFTPNPAGSSPAFNPTKPSFYDARVLQVPTNRWSVFDCQRSPGTNPTDCAAGGKLNV